MKEVYADRESNYFVRIFNYFVAKKFNDVYNTTGTGVFDKQFTDAEIESDIIDKINQEDNTKVIFIKQKLLLYNRDSVIKKFIDEINSKTKLPSLDSKYSQKLQDNYQKFITNMLNLTNGNLKAFKDIYDIFEVKDKNTIPYLNMYYARILKEKSADFESKTISGGSQYLYNLTNTAAKSRINKNLKSSMVDNTPKYKDHWQNVTKNGDKTEPNKKTLYTINKKFTKGTDYSIQSDQVRDYLAECEDMQIFYINKHILIHDLMKKVITLIKFNKIMCEQINKLTSPTEKMDANDPKNVVDLPVNASALLNDITVFNNYDKKTSNAAYNLLRNKKNILTPLPVVVSGAPGAPGTSGAPGASGASVTLGTPGAITKFELTPSADQLFNGNTMLKDFGASILDKSNAQKFVNGNTYLIDNATDPNKQDEISITDLKAKLEDTKNPLKTFYIKFGVKLTNFRDHMLNNHANNLISFLDILGNPIIQGDAEIDYVNERIKIKVLRSPSPDPNIDYEDLKIQITSFTKYTITMGHNPFPKMQKGTIYYIFHFSVFMTTQWLSAEFFMPF